MSNSRGLCDTGWRCWQKFCNRGCKCIPGFWRWLDISGLIHTRYLARAMDYPIDEGSYPLPFQPFPVQLRSHRRQMRWAARKFHGKSPASCSRQSLFVMDWNLRDSPTAFGFTDVYSHFSSLILPVLHTFGVWNGGAIGLFIWFYMQYGWI